MWMFQLLFLISHNFTLISMLLPPWGADPPDTRALSLLCTHMLVPSIVSIFGKYNISH